MNKEINLILKLICFKIDFLVVIHVKVLIQNKGNSNKYEMHTQNNSSSVKIHGFRQNNFSSVKIHRF